MVIGRQEICVEKYFTSLLCSLMKIFLWNILSWLACIHVVGGFYGPQILQFAVVDHFALESFIYPRHSPVLFYIYGLRRQDSNCKLLVFHIFEKLNNSQYDVVSAIATAKRTLSVDIDHRMMLFKMIIWENLQ